MVKTPSRVSGSGLTAAGSDAPVERAEQLAASLLADAIARRRGRERRQSRRMGRLLADPTGRDAILTLTDEVLRTADARRAAGVYAQLSTQGTNPWEDWRRARFLSPLDRLAFVAGGRLAPLLPRIVVPALRWRVKSEMAGVILPSGRRRLARHVERRSRQGMRLNVNILGEAVLGADEAAARLDRVLEALSRPEIDYVSVKISAVCAQLDGLAFEQEVERIAEPLRRLYSAAAAHGPPKFVNLDMEEFRDLDLTLSVFRKVLSEPEFRDLPAGVVLQAYLPDSFPALQDLAAWATERHRSGGAPVKVRIVKGANMAMERVDAELHGWAPAPFADKSGTDANYKRMLAAALDPSLDGALRVGVATHNLFEVAWAAVQADDLGAGDRLEFEMLEGMSPAASEAVAARFGGLLLYAPVVARRDLTAAIAYLVRRLDENSGPDNFIAHQFAMTAGSAVWEAEAARFRRSVGDAGKAAPASRRDQDRRRAVRSRVPPVEERFANAAETDFTRAANREWVAGNLSSFRSYEDGYRPVVDGKESPEPVDQDGTDPSRSGVVAYRWAAAGEETVAAAIAAARRGAGEWAARSAAARAAVLEQVAAGLEQARGRLIAAMAVDAGKTVRQGDPEVSEAVDFARWYARTIPDASSGFRPYGTVLVVSPWNFPLSIPAGGVLAALAAGNAVILKPAPETVMVAAELARVLWDSGVPSAALQFVPCVDGDASRRLVTDPGVDAVILTGSWETAGMFLDWRPDLRLHAETSGKNAMVVTATADPDEAIADLVGSAFGHAGQKCSAASVAIVEAGVYDGGDFLRRLADATRTLRVGPAAAPATVVGPLIRPPDGPLERAVRQLDSGERWLVEPEQRDGAGLLWRPGIRLGVEPGSFMHLTECFGPVLGVMRAADLAEAVEWQNQPAYGLTAGLAALDPVEIEYWRSRVQAGNLYVNRTITGAVVGRQPFGGWKRSVVGPGAKAGGPNYVASLGTWPTGHESGVGAAAYRRAWAALARPTDFVGLRAESNVFRYRPMGRVAVMGASRPTGARDAGAAAGVEVVMVDSVAEAAGGFDKLRLLGDAADDPALLREAAGAGVWVDRTPLAADATREMLRWAREQAVSESRHRHGHVTGRRPGLLPAAR